MFQFVPPNWASGQLYPDLFGSYMSPHRDNGVRDIYNLQHTGANPDKEVNSHIYGADTISVSFGDSMLYHLAVPDKDNGEDYRMNQAKAKVHIRNGTTKSIELEDMSIYIHTAHDDELFQHALTFATDEKKNKVRYVFVFRWLCVQAHFRSYPYDNRCNRYSMINKHAFEKLDKHTFTKQWYKALGYIDSNGNNIIHDIMDSTVVNRQQNRY